MSETVTLYPTASVKISGQDIYYREQGSGQVVLQGGYSHKVVCNGFSIPASKLYSPIIKASVAAYGYGVEVPAYGLPECEFRALCAPVDISTLTYSTLPILNYIGLTFFPASASYCSEDISPAYFTDKIRQIIDYGLLYGLQREKTLYDAEYWTAYVQTAYGSNKPYLRLEFGDGQCHKIVGSTSPWAGKSCNRAIAQTFDVTLKNSVNTSYKTPDVASVKLRLRAKGATAYTEVDFGTEPSKAVAGNLLPEGAFEYQFSVTDALGYTSTSDWVELYSYVSITTSRSPADGAFLDRTKPQLFSWTTVDGAAITKLRIRVKDAAEYTEYAVANSADGYTLAANVMTSGKYEWAVVGNDQYGNSWVTAWRTIDTTDAVSSAAPVSPIGTIVDNDNPVAFAWQHIISTGSAQTKADLQKSADGETWTDLVTVTSAETETVIASGTLASCTWWWRVRTYNLDGVAGTWSTAAQFVAIGSPTAPKLTVKDTSPKPVIEWQTTEQEAYELTLDGETTTAYGAAKRWQSPKYLTDGAHVVSVRVQNSYGRWSEPGAVELTVTNTPGGSIQLTAQGEGAAVRLAWIGGGYDYYLVYRDDVAIARVTETEYLDYLSCGLCTYKVRGCYAASNNYGISDPVIVEVYPRCPVIIDVETRAALWLELSEQQHRTYSMTRARQATSYHIVGQARPSVDVSEFLDETLTVSAAFWVDDRAGMRTLEALLGRVVCLKTDSGEMSVGVLTSTTKTVDMFYTSYQISVTNTELEEEVRE
nr:MAG TPA: Oligo alginate lyase [Caudoviricetes sp.]